MTEDTQAILAVLEKILEAVTPEPVEDGAVPWVIPGAKGLHQDVMGGMQGGKIKTFVRSKDRVAAANRTRQERA